MKSRTVLGIDFGTDSVRAVITSAVDGSDVGVGVESYPRWAKGLYCKPNANVFRQHPLDYLEAMEKAVKAAVKKSGAEAAEALCGIAIDTTGSTPCFVDETGSPLALHPDFSDNPNAMFVLWKDHSAVGEAEEINRVSRSWGGVDYTRFEGGIYSSEWFWAKTLHVLREDKKVRAKAVAILEHCDWMPAVLTGTKTLDGIKRSRCAAGHKALWHESWGGYPSDDFLKKLDPGLVKLKNKLGKETWTSDQVFGPLTKEWAKKLRVPAGIPVTVGAFDAHMGAVGAGVKPGVFVRIIGTSTCDIMVGPKPAVEEPVKGICGQVDGSVIPGMIGYEAGQSAFGDLYAWLRNLLLWPLKELVPGSKDLAKLEDQLIPALEAKAKLLPLEEHPVLALDWFNGRRTPDADQRLTGVFAGLNLGSDPARLFLSLVQANACATRSIVERCRSEGIVINEIVAIGGVARKSPLTMQTMADVLQAPIHVTANDQSVAAGAAIYASVAAGVHKTLQAAQKSMCVKIGSTYKPDKKKAAYYNTLYKKYQELGAFHEGLTHKYLGENA